MFILSLQCQGNLQLCRRSRRLHIQEDLLYLQCQSLPQLFMVKEMEGWLLHHQGMHSTIYLQQVIPQIKNRIKRQSPQTMQLHNPTHFPGRLQGKQYLLLLMHLPLQSHFIDIMRGKMSTVEHLHQRVQLKFIGTMQGKKLAVLHLHQWLQLNFIGTMRGKKSAVLMDLRVHTAKVWHWCKVRPFSPIPSAVPPAMNRGASASLPSVAVPSNPSGREAPSQPPIVHPSAAFPRKPTMPLPTPIRSLPPPPPSHDCTEVTCAEPLTNTLPGSPCGCVWPIQVALHLNVALYTFFPLVSELAQEIATGIFMKQSQVRIMGANAASEDQDETIVLIDLVPFGVKFDNTTAFLTFEKFWHKQVTIKPSLFGDYDVLYVRYPGLPLSPPSSPSSININGGQLTNGNNGRTIHPLGVDVRKRKGGLGGGLIVVIVLSSAIALVLSIMALWLLIWKHDGGHTHQPLSTPRSLTPLVKPTGAGSMVLGSWASSTSPTFSSSIATYTGSAKTFSIGEIEKATNKFNVSRVLGEGGFGRVYSGVLEDGTKVAVKVLKRDDQQGTREFLAEVEMLSRLHHRNLVKLLGICTDEQSRCLVYELIPNGSVESHLHGVDKETAPLDWNARMKIALGSARGLAYLHEDSSPRVIHRDFKSSNILLEHDFTPKVSDFGLARTALDGGNDHISTRVMGTFGYVAPEYAMTGHLLVKSDVYSYGVVLLELLTGRKPVDMLRSPGQENLVTWARPLLTSKDGLEMIIDPSLGSNFPFDSVAKVAAIVSMCVQPEVSHRPFMGEVVQALKLVCNEDEEKRGASGSCSQEELSSAQGIDTGASNASIQLPETRSFLTADYDAGIEVERALSASEIFSTTPRITRQDSGSFRRHSSSEPLNISKNEQFWKGGDSRGSIRERGVVIKSWGGPESENMWP
ncbi:hypothetical protein ACLOJK_037856 [Asimina triloba]